MHNDPDHDYYFAQMRQNELDRAARHPRRLMREELRRTRGSKRARRRRSGGTEGAD